MFTIFTIPKPFKDHIETIQLNALQSWILIEPSCEIILCGNEPGVREAASEFSVQHLPDLECNEYGTPLLNSTFAKVAEIAANPILCYVNADIILLNDLIEVIQRIRFPQFLMVGQRINVDLRQRWNFGRKDWRRQLREFAAKEGELAFPLWIDYFVFTPNGQLEKLPPFAVGRPTWDSWFIYHARRSRIPVIDATCAVTAIHQNHDYSHIPQKDGKRWKGPEATTNRELSGASMGGSNHAFSILDATHVVTDKTFLPAFSARHLKQRLRSLAVLHPTMKPLVQTLRPLARAPKWIKRRFLRTV